MEQIANLHIEKLPEGVYLATSEDIPGLVAQGRTITETIEIARDVAKVQIAAGVPRRAFQETDTRGRASLGSAGHESGGQIDIEYAGLRSMHSVWPRRNVCPGPLVTRDTQQRRLDRPVALRRSLNLASRSGKIKRHASRAMS